MRTWARQIQKSKQRSAFPPNFVHSLDSTHMLLTAVEFHRRGERQGGRGGESGGWRRGGGGVGVEGGGGGEMLSSLCAKVAE